MIGTSVIWKLIVKYGNPETPFGKLVLPMEEERVEAIEAHQAQLLAAMGIPHVVISAYQDVLLLYLEHEAITRMILTLGDPELRGLYPEILSRDEAVYVMSRDHMMMPDQCRLLKEILPNESPTELCEKVDQSWLEAIQNSWLEDVPNSVL